MTTKDGRAVLGFRRPGPPDTLALLDPATGQTLSLKLSEIATNESAGSLMPAGLTDSLSRQELRDLLAYLGSLGR